MDLDVLVMKFHQLQEKVDEIRKRLGMDEPEHPPPLETHPAETTEADEEEVEEHDPETGHTRRARRKRG